MTESKLLNDTHWNTIKNWLPSKRFERLYCASIDGYNCLDFHRKCDNAGPTLVVLRTSYGNLIGGYSCLNWQSSNNSYEYAMDIGKSCFLFSLTRNEKYICTTNDYAICNSGSHGPKFGGGHDLEIVSDCNVAENQYSGIGHSYQWNGGDTSNFYGGNRFTVPEYEVFKVIYEDPLNEDDEFIYYD